MLTLLLIHAILPQGQGTSTAPVVINEFQYDDAGTDNFEFVELYNRSAVPVDISGWQIVANDPTSTNAAYTISAATILAPGAFYVIGAATVPNVNQVVGSTNLWENDNESLELNASPGVIDSVAYETNKGIWAPHPREGNGLFGNFLSADTGQVSWSRYLDGFDNNDNGRDFRIRPWTPGSTNAPANVLPWSENGSTGAGNPLPNWAGYDLAPQLVNPTLVVGQNPRAIPVSPQGGVCAVFAALGTSGGRSFMMNTAAVDRASFDAWVYLDIPAAGDTLAWSIGVLGTTDSLYELPDPDRTAAVDVNGDTGVAWTYRATSTGGVLWLIDNGDGGRDHIVLARIVNGTAGWVRLCMNVANGQCRARHGGNVGAGDGLLISRPVDSSAGGIYVGIRTQRAAAGPAYAVWLDEIGFDKTATTTSTNDPGCDGNCPPRNRKLEKLDTVALDGSVPPGDYAFLVPFNGDMTTSALCFKTAWLNETATTTWAELCDVDTSNLPGTVRATSSAFVHTAMGGAKGPQWWIGDFGSPVTITGNFYIVLHLDAQLHPPIVALPYEPILAQYRATSSGTWAPDTGQRGWSWLFACAGMNTLGTSIDLAGAEGPGITITEHLHGGLPSGLAFALLGFAPILVSLDPFGIPGCWQLVNPLATIFVLLDGGGNGAYPITIPNLPTFSGLSIHTQWAVLDPAANALGITVSGSRIFTVL